jgi:hypothetical protein
VAGHALVLSRKALGLAVQAMDYWMASEAERYRREDVSEDAAGDFGNDLHYITLLRDEFAAKQNAEAGSAHLYQCWFDAEDRSLSLLQYHRVQECRAQGTLSERAVLQYEFAAETGEEAMAIHSLRQGWGPYLPMGDAAPCPTCGTAYYPLGYGDCWRCGHIG